MKGILLGFSLMVLLAFGAAVQASDGADLYKRCKGCHGADGSKPQGEFVIKGKSADQLEAAMLGYKAGTYGGERKAIMVSQLGKLSDEEIRMLAEHMAGF